MTTRQIGISATRAKSNAHYQCQNCGSTEMIQAHHVIPKNDDTIIVLCGKCHSEWHTNMPKGLFLNKRLQPYWNNKSASSLAKELKVHPRTIIRISRKPNIQPGKLSKIDKILIISNLHKNKNNQLRRKVSLKRKLVKTGNSRAVIIPSDWIRYYEEKYGKPVVTILMELGNIITITVEETDGTKAPQYNSD